MENTGASNNVYGQCNTGYTCRNCGTWVWTGTGHACTYQYWHQQPPYYYVYYPQPCNHDQEIVTQLKTIVKLLQDIKYQGNSA